ncbi:hypothetical protein PO124_04845 [Bacillus licheniformis]|nr:hypothetical protein [Bacillus licheniformis]
MGFDNCKMAGIETAYALRDYGKYMLASVDYTNQTAGIIKGAAVCTRRPFNRSERAWQGNRCRLRTAVKETVKQKTCSSL